MRLALGKDYGSNFMGGWHADVEIRFGTPPLWGWRLL